MPLVQRFETIAPGVMVLTGNTVVINGATASPPAATPFFTGAFTSTNNALQVPGFPLGTTLNGV